MLPLVLLVTMLAARLARGRRVGSDGGTGARRVVDWAVFAVPLIAFTATVIVADTIKTSSWTLPRQELGVLAGRSGCGLATDLRVPSSVSSGGVRPLSQRLDDEGSRSLVLPSLVTYFPCIRLPELRDGVVEVPDHIVTYPIPFHRSDFR